MIRNIFITLMLVLTSYCVNAQFAKGTRFIGPSFSVNFSDQFQTQYYTTPYRKSITDNLNQTYNVSFQYGYFKKENVMMSLGLSYTFGKTSNQSEDIDTNYYRFNS